MKLDNTLDNVQNSRFRNLYHNLNKQMQKLTSFSEMELDCILLVYHKFVLANGKRAKFMTRDQFTAISHALFKISDSKSIDRMLFAIDPDTKLFVLPQTWVKLLWTFLRGNLEDKIIFCFKVYDLQGHGLLTREILRLHIRNFVIGDQEEDVVEISNDMVDTIVRRMDIDRDGSISFDDYANTVRNTPCLLEFLGRLIPTKNSINNIIHSCNIASDLRQLLKYNS